MIVIYISFIGWIHNNTVLALWSKLLCILWVFGRTLDGKIVPLAVISIWLEWCIATPMDIRSREWSLRVVKYSKLTTSKITWKDQRRIYLLFLFMCNSLTSIFTILIIFLHLYSLLFVFLVARKLILQQLKNV